MKTANSLRQCGHDKRFSGEGRVSSSPPQPGHFKCIIELMKPLLLLLLVAGSLSAQTIADVARKERERHAQVKAVRVITSTEPKAEEPKPAPPANDPAKVGDAPVSSSQTSAKPSDSTKPALPTIDPVEVWNNKTNELRTKIRTLQDQEVALQLQLNQANNQVYAPVTDQATQERALALVAQIQKTIADVRKDLDETKTSLDSMLLQGPPKK